MFEENRQNNSSISSAVFVAKYNFVLENKCRKEPIWFVPLTTATAVVPVAVAVVVDVTAAVAAPIRFSVQRNLLMMTVDGDGGSDGNAAVTAAIAAAVAAAAISYDVYWASAENAQCRCYLSASKGFTAITNFSLRL